MPQGREAQHGPLGGLPAFCRLGGSIATSKSTSVLFEVWLPLISDPSIDLAYTNSTDYPTDSTPIELATDGSYLKGPPDLIASNPGSSKRSSLVSAGNFEKRSDGSISGEELLGSSSGWNKRLLYINNGGQR